MADISGKLSMGIGEAQTYDSSANLRCGKSQFMVTRVRAEDIQNDKGTKSWVFFELLPLKSEPNPQTEGDRQGFSYSPPPNGGGYVAGTGPLVDDGMNPNRVGEPCALKANFTDNAKVAESKVKAIMLAILGKTKDEIAPVDVARAFEDFARQKSAWCVEGWKLGDAVVPQGTPGARKVWSDLVLDASGRGLLPVTKDTPGAVWKPANPCAGLVIDCVTKNSKKRTANEKGAYVGVQNWTCVAPYGVGENSDEARAARFAQYGHQAKMGTEGEVGDDDAPGAPIGSPASLALPVAAGQNGASTWTPPAPWRKYPNVTAPAPDGTEWWWNGEYEEKSVSKSFAQLRAMFPAPPVAQPAPPPVAQPAPPPVAQPAPPPVAFIPPKPWIPHPAHQGVAPDGFPYYWSDNTGKNGPGGTNEVKTVTALRQMLGISA